jgi:hypothetical protein
MAYNIFITLHSIVRWLVVLFALLAIGRAFAGWLGRRPWTAIEDRLGMLFTAFFDLQVLFGIILYFFLSPLTVPALQNLGVAMSSDILRFFTVEHVALMLVAAGVAHMGRSLAKKAPDDRSKFKRAAIFYTIAIVLVLAAIPWPFLAYGRPLLRF